MNTKRLNLSMKVAAFGLAAFCSLASAKNVAAAPAAPADAAQKVSTQDGFKVAWTKVNGATDYMVSISADGKSFTAEESTKGACEYAKIDAAKAVLKPGTTYIVKIRAIDASGSSSPVSIKVATAPEVMTSFEQVGATNTTAKMSWSASAGATGYLIKMGADAASAKDLVTVTTTTVNLTGLKADSAYYVAVYPIRKVTDKFFASDKCAYSNKVITTAPAVQKLAVAEWDVNRNFTRISWKNSAKYEGGYQVEVYNEKGNLYKSYNVRGRKLKSYSLNLKKLKNKGFAVRVRTYNKLADTMSYGEWSELLYCVPQASGLTAKKINNTSVELSWNKVNNCKKYQIMMASEDGGTYKKVGTSKGTTYTVSGLAEGKDYYFYVNATKIKVDGKKKNSTALDVPNDVHVSLQPGRKAAEIE